ncbi:MAG TPA: hypothetical protein VFW07_03750 [Parafilimonas sp.]|nr:hypothetical protein [Parafilimonas sp.]
MNCKIGFTAIALACFISTIAQKKITTFPDSIAPVGIIKNISGAALLDIVQRQTFRFFPHYADPVSGLARERDNTVHGDYYWWKLFMQIPDVQNGLKKLGFKSPYIK